MLRILEIEIQISEKNIDSEKIIKSSKKTFERKNKCAKKSQKGNKMGASVDLTECVPEGLFTKVACGFRDLKNGVEGRK